uniref:dynactin subunit 3-like n=1 Tax=Callospermophilus lateralis TaxID=76772 RepID=UPI00403854C4
MPNEDKRTSDGVLGSVGHQHLARDPTAKAYFAWPQRHLAGSAGLVEDLIKYLDPEYIDRIAIPDATKLQFILAEEQFILSQVALLEQVDNLVPMLDSAPIKAVPEHAARLQHLAQIHIQQQDKCVEITEESKALLEEYNKITMLLSKQFVQWDELLCQLEAAKQVKPAEE